MEKNCKTCNISACKGFRDREGRCPEYMVGNTNRWRMPRIDPHATARQQDEQTRIQVRWLLDRGYKWDDQAKAIKEGY